MNKSLEKNYFNSVVDELFLQHKYHIHKLIGFSHFKTNETLHVNEINYEINYDIKPQLDIIFYNSKFEKINYDNSININFFTFLKCSVGSKSVPHPMYNPQFIKVI